MLSLKNPNNLHQHTSCVNCGGILRRFRIKLIATSNPHSYWPKYVPQIKEICVGCDQYVRFAPQTPELIETFNNYFAENDVEVNEDV